MGWWRDLFPSPVPLKSVHGDPRLVTYRCHRIVCPACKEPFEDGETVVRTDGSDPRTGATWWNISHVRCVGAVVTPPDDAVNSYEMTEQAIGRLAGGR